MYPVIYQHIVDIDRLESGPKMLAIFKFLQIFRKFKEKCLIFTNSKTHVISIYVVGSSLTFPRVSRTITE